MNKKGIGSTVDILSLTVLISISCLILIGGTQNAHKETSHYAEKVTQNTLLILQKVPIQEFGNFYYTPNFSFKKVSKRKLKNKPISKIITEEILLNPKLTINNLDIKFQNNEEHSQVLEKAIKKSLDALFGKKFEYRMEIRMKPTRISENTLISYRKNIGKIPKTSQKICSRRIKLYFSVPKNWKQDELLKNKETGERTTVNPFFSYQKSEGSKENKYSSDTPLRENIVPIFLTLELWSN